MKYRCVNPACQRTTDVDETEFCQFLHNHMEYADSFILMHYCPECFLEMTSKMGIKKAAEA